MDIRFIRIAKILHDANDFVTAGNLAITLNISTKTISRIIKTNKTISESHGFLIHSKTGRGYMIEVTDSMIFNRLIMEKNLYAEKFQLQKTSNQRVFEIIFSLLITTKPINIDDLFFSLFVSDSTFLNDFNETKSILSQYNLSVKLTNSFIFVQGEELNKRLLLSNIAKNDYNFKNKVLNHSKKCFGSGEFLKKIIVVSTIKHEIYLSDNEVENLSLHIFILYLRKYTLDYLPINRIEESQIKNSVEYLASKEICSKIENHYSISFFEQDIIYISIQLMGKKTVHSIEDINSNDLEIELVLSQIFDKIKNTLGIDLRNDFETTNYLMLHFSPMIIRVKYGMQVINPLMMDVKKEQMIAFEMGLIAKSVINTYYDISLNDHEVSYLAMYFAVALDKLNYINNPKNILIICDLRRSNSNLLQYKLRQTYTNMINVIETVNLNDIYDTNLSDFDCLINLTNSNIATSTPVLFLGNYISNWNLSLEKLNTFFYNKNSFDVSHYITESNVFFKEQIDSPEEAINYIVQNLKLPLDEKENLLANTLEREGLSSTSYGNYCALPHPIKLCTKETVFAALILNKPVMWGQQKVKYIFLYSPQIGDFELLRGFNNALSKFISNPKNLKEFDKSPDIYTLKELFNIS